jgi:hypothetical protein
MSDLEKYVDIHSVTSQTSYSPEYTTPAQKKIMHSLLTALLNKQKKYKHGKLLTRI